MPRDRPALGEYQYQAASEAQHGEGHDEGGDPDIGYERPVDGPHRQSDGEPDKDREDRVEAELHGPGGGDSGQPHHRADREVDSAREDDEELADRHDRDERYLARDEVEILAAHEVRREDGDDSHDEDEGEQDG